MLTCIVQSKCGCGPDCAAPDLVPAIVIMFAPNKVDKEAVEKALADLAPNQTADPKIIQASAEESIALGASLADILKLFLIYQQVQGGIVHQAMKETGPQSPRADDNPFTGVTDADSFLDMKL